MAFFAAFVVAAWATSAKSQEYCGTGSVAHAVQVTFTTDCGHMPDNVSVYEGDHSGQLLPLMKAPSGYWEADKKTFDPAYLMLCSPECSNANGCVPPSETIAIERGLRRVCAARYVIQCTEQVWKLHVETKPGRWLLLYKTIKRTQGATATQHQGGKTTPFDLCSLAYDEQVETVLQLQGRNSVSIQLRPIHIGLFERGQTVDVDRDEIARGYQTALRMKRALSVEERERLPKLVTFKLVDR